ncbi:hypothetical protein AAFF_G00363570 [Aldrovandia affinis]|uniref:Uncharacterized protein n=1 Tax=Aldrovandia affinis TaxID=143900 RepID=A0AAD7SHY7_9TELE|nr:hypothetical protein AAFF_G00363570 [Aldrovandia affinis]
MQMSVEGEAEVVQDGQLALPPSCASSEMDVLRTPLKEDALTQPRRQGSQVQLDHLLPVSQKPSHCHNSQIQTQVCQHLSGHPMPSGQAAERSNGKAQDTIDKI